MLNNLNYLIYSSCRYDTLCKHWYYFHHHNVKLFSMYVLGAITKIWFDVLPCLQKQGVYVSCITSERPQILYWYSHISEVSGTVQQGLLQLSSAAELAVCDHFFKSTFADFFVRFFSHSPLSILSKITHINYFWTPM